MSPISALSAYRPCLSVFVVWHPSYNLGQPIARRVYSHLCRDVQAPTSRGIGVPVFFRSAAQSDAVSLPLDAPLDAAHHTAVIVLVDDNMINGNGWDGYVEKIWLATQASGTKHRLFPVRLSEHAFNLSKEIQECNYLRLNAKDDDSRMDELLVRLTHELCRQLLGKKRVADAATPGSTEASPLPVTLFLSHAKKDGEETAKKIRDYIQSTLPLKTFFDALDIAPGFSFKNEIDAGIERAALLVIQTDAYSSREWCQHEIMWAKKRQRPVVVVHAISQGEKRSFPYAGNVPTRRWDGSRTNDCECVVGDVLHQVLRFEYFRQHFETLRALYNFPKDVFATPCPPELLTGLYLCSGKSPPQLVVYPDPPLGAEELELLRQLAPNMTVTTPTLLVAEVA